MVETSSRLEHDRLDNHCQARRKTVYRLGCPGSAIPAWPFTTQSALSRTFYFRAASPAASVDVAAMAAAQRVLVNYFPSQQGDLDRKFAASPANIDGDAGAKDAGISVGEAASAAVIAARSEDGLDATDKRALYAERRTGCLDPPTPPAYGCRFNSLAWPPSR
jgi:hypothetical protein